MTAKGKPDTLHARILRELEQRIVGGHWKPGHRLPFEVELAAHYGCSRMTVNKVLTQLARQGLIERRRKSGSFVAQPVTQAAVLEIHDIEAEVRSLGLPYRYRLEHRRQRPVRDHERDQLDAGDRAEAIELRALHLAGERPFCLEQRLISLGTVPEAAGEDFHDGAPGRWLLNRVPWNQAEHRIQAIGATADIASALGIARNAACLVIERRTWGPGGAVTFVRFTYPGDRHALVARFAPGAEGEWGTGLAAPAIKGPSSSP